MNAPKLLDLILAAGPGAYLKGQGFRKKGRAFYRRLGVVFQYVHFYPSQCNSGPIAGFTLQVGATLPFRHPKQPETMITDLIPIAGRWFGPDLDHPVGQFWITDSIYPTADEVLERLEHHVLPFLARHASEVDLQALWRSTGSKIQGPTIRI